MLIAASILVLVALLVFFVLGRFFCMWICPVGYILKWTHKLHPNRIRVACDHAAVDQSQCTGCMKCVRSCPMGAIKYVPKHPKITPEYRKTLLEQVPSMQEILKVGRSMDPSSRSLVMGILNLSEESFFSDSITEPDSFMARFEDLLSAGSDIIDIGACSSRPGSEPVDMEVEWSRLERPLKKVAKKYPVAPVISIDTVHAEIIRRAVKILGTNRLIVNDIAGRENIELIKVSAELGLPYIITYNGRADMGADAAEAMVAYFQQFEKTAAECGLENYILDPGIGFGGKSIEENYQLLAGLDILKSQDRPILVGLSRKSLIYKYLGITPKDSLEGTVALDLYAIEHGADIIRVHDPLQGVQTVKMAKMLLHK